MAPAPLDSLPNSLALVIGAKMLFVAVIEPPHNKETITHSEVDPEIDHEDTQFKPGHRQELLTLGKATRRCFNPTKSHS